MAADVGAEVFGIDASEALIGLARECLPGADLRIGDMESLPFEDDFFDLVTGFNSFFFAADMVAALREAERVARPGAPVLLQVWGQPDHCELGVALKKALDSVLPPSQPAASGPKLWEEGVLEAISSQAGLLPQSRFVTRWAFEFPNSETMQEDLLAPALVVDAVSQVGETAVRAAILEALAPYRTRDGRYRLENEWCYLLTRAQ
jgi:SAM-dependent methyltransferase